MEIAMLNKQFGAAGRIAFRAGAGGMPVATMAGVYGSCEVSLYGAQVLSYQPLGHAPALFMSSKAVFEAGKPIRGGIPVCWPWFGPHPERKNMPAHGFVRLLPWTVIKAEYSAQVTDMLLGLRDSEATRAFWPYAFGLTLRVVLDKDLRVELATHNTDHSAMTISEALHTYLLVRDIARTTVDGLQGARYFDALAGSEHPPQAGRLSFHGEIDRIYHDEGEACFVHDNGLGRQITVSKRGSRATVVWNPWVEKSRRLRDIGADDYQRLLCVETANVMAAAVVLPPGETHTMALSLRVEMARPS